MVDKKINKKSNIEVENLNFIRDTLTSLNLKINETADLCASLYGEFKEFKAVQQKEIKYLKEKNEMQIERIQTDIASMNKKCSNLPCRDHTMQIENFIEQNKNIADQIKNVENINQKQDERFHQTVQEISVKFNNILIRGMGASIFLVGSAIATGIAAYLIK